MQYFFNDNKTELIAFVLGTLAICFAAEAFFNLPAFQIWKKLFIMPLFFSIIIVSISQYVNDDGRTMKVKYFWIICLAFFLIQLLTLALLH